MAFSLLIGAASGATGWLLGLLFGVPKINKGDESSSALETSKDGGTDITTAQKNKSIIPNTNLEEISDWLTKTLIGVGLTQLYTFPLKFWNFCSEINSYGVKWDVYGQAFVCCVIVYYFSGGFWLSWIYTRTWLTAGIDRYDRDHGILDSVNPVPLKISTPLDRKPDETENPDQPTKEVKFEHLTGDAARLDDKLKNIQFESLNSTQEYAAWGAAQARSGNTVLAIKAFEMALQKAKNNTQYKKILAGLYMNSGRLREAWTVIKDTDDSILKLFISIYQPPPNGYTQAIKIGNALLSTQNFVKSSEANIHVWLVDRI